MNFGVAYRVSNVQETINVVNFTVEQVADFSLQIANDPAVDVNSVIVTIPA